MAPRLCDACHGIGPEYLAVCGVVVTMLTPTQRQPGRPATHRRPPDLRAVWIGVGAGVIGIVCCVSPVVLFLLGISTAAEAITLGDRLYHGYAWYFRGAGLLLAAAATIIYLRRRRSCSIAGAAAHWRTLLSVGVTMVVTYAVLYAITGYLAALASHAH